jgi:hypothetical protein
MYAIFFSFYLFGVKYSQLLVYLKNGDLGKIISGNDRNENVEVFMEQLWNNHEKSLYNPCPSQVSNWTSHT